MNSKIAFTLFYTSYEQWNWKQLELHRTELAWTGLGYAVLLLLFCGMCAKLHIAHQFYVHSYHISCAEIHWPIDNDDKINFSTPIQTHSEFQQQKNSVQTLCTCIYFSFFYMCQAIVVIHTQIVSLTIAISLLALENLPHANASMQSPW